MVTRAGKTGAIAVGFVLLWNSGFIGAEFGLPNSGPFTLLLWRYLALMVLLGVVVGVRRLRNAAHSANWPKALPVLITALVGVLSHGVWLGCVLLALDRHVPAGIVSLVVAVQPLATGAFSGLATGEKTRPVQWLGLGIGFAGVAVAVGARMSSPDSATVFGYLIPFGSVVAITVASLVQRRRELSSRSVPLLLDTQLLIQSAATALVVVVPAILLEGLATEWTTGYLMTMSWLVVAVSFGAYACMWVLLSRLDATRVASLFYLGPPVTMVMAWIAFGDTVNATDLLGLAVVAVGVLIVTQAGRTRAHVG
ncbi:MAG: DMT family transporter [bacterium]